MIKQHDKHARARALAEDDKVLARNYSGSPKWLPGTIIKETGPVSGEVELEDGTVVRRHHDQLLPRQEQPKEPKVAEVTEPTPAQVESTPDPVVERRYPTRERRPPDRFQ
ncbi:uncharacterized protein LOC116289694 [Actinia tenebrosa]|uniref:Uncharacterized protein LOC116289694 n=1 Tax=Actinia tenebrosa TaxID=6105 RepID=A0A6P8HBK3_ACTTE|nr:uncharacterized protein LOC116289694 [Actinia tenebrosa]